VNQETDLPGPGHYPVVSKVGNEGRKISIKGRTTAPDGKIISAKILDIIRIVQKEAVPGPGTYQPKTGIDKNGVYFVSNIE
jgi:hypothetical protein